MQKMQQHEAGTWLGMAVYRCVSLCMPVHADVVQAVRASNSIR